MNKKIAELRDKIKRNTALNSALKSSDRILSKSFQPKLKKKIPQIVTHSVAQNKHNKPSTSNSIAVQKTLQSCISKKNSNTPTV